MARLKMLRSIGHNTAHSYLSLMNYIKDEYTVERIFRIAKLKKKPKIVIDILNKKIEPEDYCMPEILESLEYLNKSFLSLLNAEKMGFEHIKSAIIKIKFDLENITLSKNVPGLELPAYDCIVEIEDFNGKMHTASLVEWWKY